MAADWNVYRSVTIQFNISAMILSLPAGAAGLDETN